MDKAIVTSYSVEGGAEEALALAIQEGWVWDILEDFSVIIGIVGEKSVQVFSDYDWDEELGDTVPAGVNLHYINGTEVVVIDQDSTLPVEQIKDWINA